MKNKVIKGLKGENLSEKEHYNLLLGFLAQKVKAHEMRAFQLGFSAFKYENLKNKVKQLYGISDLDIYHFKEEEEEEEQTTEKALTEEEKEAAQLKHAEEAKNQAIKQKVLAGLENNTEAKEGLKIREEYPFLNEENCPEEFYILVGKKISAWKSYAQSHAILEDELSEEDNEEKIYNIAKKAVADFQLNADMKEELDYYNQTRKVLGKVEVMEPLKIKQEIYEMSEGDLVKHRGNAQKSISKYKDKEAKQHLVKKWETRLKWVETRLIEEFKHNLK